MLLDRLQTELEAIYEIQSAHRVHDFVTHDAALITRLDSSRNARDIPEKLLIHQDGDYLDVALYLDAQAVANLERHDPLARLDDDNLEEFCVVLEGISHFVYLTYNAQYDREISLFELELQAEVDKFILAARLLSRQCQTPIPQALHHLLYRCAEFDTRLQAHEFHRYYKANALAGRFSAFIGKCINKGMADWKIFNTLRRFYRLTHHQKIRSIESLPA